jgi:hypothetical protein
MMLPVHTDTTLLRHWLIVLREAEGSFHVFDPNRLREGSRPPKYPKICGEDHLHERSTLVACPVADIIIDWVRLEGEW